MSRTRIIPYSDVSVSEHASLVLVGVRSMALLGCVPNANTEKAHGELTQRAIFYPDAIPFTVPQDSESHIYGYAAKPWVVDLLRWIHKNEIPQYQRDRIIGLLQGHSPRVIATRDGGIDDRIGIPPVSTSYPDGETTQHWPHDLSAEHASLISAGVRPLAIVGWVDADQAESAYTELAGHVKGWSNVIPFVVPHYPGRVVCGYTAELWLIDLLRWIYEFPVPSPQEDRITGLLLGYSPRAIEIHDARVFAFFLGND